MQKTFVVKKSAIEGKGCFATRDIKKSERICSMEGKSISVAKLRQRFLLNKRISCDAFQISVRSYIELVKPYIYFNHSCRPNTGVAGRHRLVALRDIQKGEEITYDYSATEWTPQDYTEYDHTVWPMSCRCGVSECRGRIGCFPYIPKQLQWAYVRSGIIQSYILKKRQWPATKRRCAVWEARLISNGIS